MIKLLNICLLFLFISNLQAQNSKKYNDSIISSYKKQINDLKRKKINVDTLGFKIHKTIKELDQILSDKKFKKDSTTSKLTELYVDNILMLQRFYLAPKSYYDSIIYYKDKLQKKTKNPYYLGASFAIASNAYGSKSDYFNQIFHLKEAINYYDISKNVSANYGKIILQIELCEIYNRYNLNSISETLAHIIEKELDKLIKHEKKRKSKKRLQSLLVTYQLTKCTILLALNKKKDVLLLLKAIENKNLEELQFKTNTFRKISSLYNKLGMPEKAIYFFEKSLIEYKTKYNSTNLTKDGLKLANLTYSNLYFQLNDTYKANLYFNKYITDTITEGYNSYDVQKKLAFFYEKNIKYKKAIKHIKRSQFLKDSITTSGFNILNMLHARELNFEKRVLEIEHNSKNKILTVERETYFLKYIIVIVFFVSVLILIIVYFYKNRKNYKTKLELSKTKEILTHKNTFLENISHEMRTPITIVLGYLSLIQNKILDPKKVLKYSNIAISNSEELIANLNSFLKVSQLENNADRQIISESKKLNSFLIGIVSSFSANSELKKIKLFYKSNIKKDVIIEYEYSAIQKILENLISNALKYSNSNTSVYIQNTIDEKNIILSVKDEGIGIKDEDQKNIFNKFYQSKEHAVAGGFGIGLYLVYELVNHLKGTIILNSKLNVGSIFTLTIPHQLKNYKLFTKNMEKDFSLITIDYEEETTPKNLPLALIVDDNIEMISYYKELLSNSLRCFFAFNANEALEIIKNEAIDIIISDYRMPIMNGIEFKKVLNKDNNLKDIPFIMVTAVAYDFENDPKMTLGLNDYITKPFDKNELKTRIRALLENKMYAKQLLFYGNKKEIVFKNEYSELLNKVNTIIRKNLNNSKFDAKTLASECGYTQRNLNNVLQKATGLTLVKTVLEIRLQKAYEFIINNTYSSLNEIMFKTGFNSRPYFYKKFENRFGIKPGVLKKKHLK